MKPVVRFYAVLVVLTLVGLVVWAGADWYQQRQAAREGAQTLLRQTAGQVTNLSIPGPLGSESLARVFNQSLGTDPRWKVVVLASPERGTEFYRGPRPAVPVDQAVPHWAPRQASEVEVTLAVFRAGTTPLTLSAIYEFYGRAEIFSLLKACGATLFVLLVLTTIVVLTTRLRDQGEPARESGEPSEDGSRDRSWADLDAGSGASVAEASITDPDLNDSEVNDWAVPDLERPPSAGTEDEYWFEDTPDFDLPPLDPPGEAVSPSVPPQAPSLVSPSGLGWASFLETRLGKELERCAGQNQDLALVVVRPKTPAAGWITDLLEAFPSVDLNFEYEDGAAVVLPGYSLEAALARARSFVGTTAVAGVASRNGRLLSASTLMGEAVSARNRAQAGNMAVLGLKTDPERWRAHLAS